MKDILEQLADLEVRDPPTDFNRRLHQRVNRALLVQHVLDFFVGGMIYGVGHFVRAALGWLHFTVTGRYPERD